MNNAEWMHKQWRGFWPANWRPKQRDPYIEQTTGHTNLAFRSTCVRLYWPYSAVTCSTVRPMSSLENTVTAEGSFLLLMSNNKIVKKGTFCSNDSIGDPCQPFILTRIRWSSAIDSWAPGLETTTTTQVKHYSVVHTSTFSLTSFICLCEREKKASFYLTSPLVRKLAYQLFNKETCQGNTWQLLRPQEQMKLVKVKTCSCGRRLKLIAEDKRSTWICEIDMISGSSCLTCNLNCVLLTNCAWVFHFVFPYFCIVK